MLSNYHGSYIKLKFIIGRDIFFFTVGFCTYGVKSIAAYENESRQWYHNVLEDTVFLLVTYNGRKKRQKANKSYLMMCL